MAVSLTTPVMTTFVNFVGKMLIQRIQHPLAAFKMTCYIFHDVFDMNIYSYIYTYVYIYICMYINAYIHIV